jgi:two-component system sensor histidine kinase YesM
MVLGDTVRAEETASNLAIPQIDKLVDNILYAQKELEAQVSFKKIFSSTETIVKGNSDGNFYSSTFCNKVRELIDQKTITNIVFYVDVDKSEEIFHNEDTKQIFKPIDDGKGSYWYGIFQGNQSCKSLFCPEFYLSPDEINNFGDMAYITKTSVIYNGEYRTCYCSIYYSKKPFTELLKTTLAQDTSVVYIINDRDSTVATSDELLSGFYHFSYEQVHDSFMSSNNFILKTILDQDVYAGFYNIKKTDWFLISIIPSKVIISKTKLIIMYFIIACVIYILIAFFTAIKLSSSITNRISSIIEKMSKVRTSPPTPLPQSLYHDEIGSLIDTYNYMTLTINQLIEQHIKAVENLRISEFRALQAQINPHFLYNTMDMIKWMALNGQGDEVSQVVIDLSKFYKLTLSKKDVVSTIADELEHASLYVKLQNMRYNGIIDLVNDMPDYMMDLTIPKLTFQPLVENAIIHGLFEKIPRGGTIVITGWIENETAVILISDNGVGMSKEKLSTILSSTGTSKTGSKIAIYNTNLRLHILYGNNSGLSYRSEVNKGTEVEIRVSLSKNNLND